MTSPNVTIIDVSPRDGLQMEESFIETDKKVLLVQKLIDANVKHIEVSSFVHPKRVPQMADAKELISKVPIFNGMTYTALIPNTKGFERAKETKVTEVNWVTAATDSFNANNLAMTIEENFIGFAKMLEQAKQHKIKTCLSIAVSFGCPFEGEVKESQVLSLVERAVKLNVDRISIADTIGIATPKQSYDLLSKVLNITGDTPVAVHLHDTRGLGLANAYKAFEAGVTFFESSASGIGGCPFAPGAAGNIATEDLVYMFEKMGITTGVDFEKLLDAADFAASLTSREPLGRIRKIERKKEKML